jgi:hypothetical protein
MQACAIRQHQECTVHRVAKSLFLSPDRPVSELLPYDLKDQDLFRGNVPQPADWLRAWSACKRVTSFRSAAQHFQTEDYAWGRRCSVVAKSFLSAIMYLLLFAWTRVLSFFWEGVLSQMDLRLAQNDHCHALGYPIFAAEATQAGQKHQPFSG